MPYPKKPREFTRKFFSFSNMIAASTVKCAGSFITISEKLQFVKY